MKMRKTEDNAKREKEMQSVKDYIRECQYRDADS